MLMKTAQFKNRSVSSFFLGRMSIIFCVQAVQTICYSCRVAEYTVISELRGFETITIPSSRKIIYSLLSARSSVKLHFKELVFGSDI